MSESFHKGETQQERDRGKRTLPTQKSFYKLADINDLKACREHGPMACGIPESKALQEIK